MKITKISLTAALLMLVFTVTATRTSVSTSPSSTELKQCGVTNAQITAYLQDCSHHHTVYWVQDVPGTCNSTAGIEGCKIATVYVQNGRVIGHMDSQSTCD